MTRPCTSEEFIRMTKAERNLNQKERKNVGYGLGRPVKTVTSAFKRVFGESVGALNPHTAVIEIATKVVSCIIPSPLHRSHAAAAWRSQFCGGPPHHPHPAGGFAPDWHIQAHCSAQGMHSDSETNPDSMAHAAVTSGHGQAAAGGPVSGGRRLAPTTASLMSRLRL